MNMPVIAGNNNRPREAASLTTEERREAFLEPLTRGHSSSKESIVVIDMKGDDSLFHNNLEECLANGLALKWYTNVRGRSTYAFNPFWQKHFRSDLDLNQRTELFLKALGLTHGERYGASFFGAVNHSVLRFFLSLGEVRNCSDLAHYLRHHGEQFYDGPKEDLRDARHVANVFATMGSIPALNFTPDNSPPSIAKHAIDIGDVFDSPQLLHFHLQSLIEPVSVRGVARLALYALLTAAATKERRKVDRVYLFVDELQRLVGRSIDIFLQQARSFGISCIFAHQSIGDLETDEGDMTEIISESTNIKISCSANGLKKRAELEARSGERFGSDAAREFTKNVETCVVELHQPDGYTQFGGMPLPVEMPYHIGPREYLRRMNAPWPRVEDYPGTFVQTGGREQDQVSTERPRAADERPTLPYDVPALPPDHGAGGFDLNKRIEELRRKPSTDSGKNRKKKGD